MIKSGTGQLRGRDWESIHFLFRTRSRAGAPARRRSGNFDVVLVCARVLVCVSVFPYNVVDLF